jgi:hypothetical protein
MFRKSGHLTLLGLSTLFEREGARRTLGRMTRHVDGCGRCRVDLKRFRATIRLARISLIGARPGAAGSGKKPKRNYPAWVKCPGCDSFFCTIHGKHAFECPCPSIDRWKKDPYLEGGRDVEVHCG